jgi:hypothetical protein
MCEKICKDCKFFDKPDIVEFCWHPKNTETDPISGTKTQKECPGVMRVGANFTGGKKVFAIIASWLLGECGPNARWFEPKDNEDRATESL